MTGNRPCRGFSLVEILVGVTIGILSSIVVFQVFALSERQKRTTTGAADAQTNGAVALFMLERDARMAGWGLENSTFANCANVYSYLNDGASAAPISDIFASAIITDGGSNPDTVLIQYYADPAERGFKFSVTTLRTSMPQPSSELNVSSTYGCDVNDLALVIQGGNCTLVQITQVQEAALKLQHNPGGTPSYNPTAAYQNANNWPAYTSGASMQCFSNRFFRRTYRINANQLELLEPDTAGVTQSYQVAPEILDLQAQYGIADVGSQKVNDWVDATGAWASPLTTVNARRIKALRIALVARSPEYEKPDAGGTCATTTADMVAGWSAWAVFDTGAYPSDWQCYRYKVFETVVPLRNIIWANL